MIKNEAGPKRLHDILGNNSETIIENFKKTSPDFANYIVDFVYGDIYARPGLSDKMREMAAVACLIGQGNTALPLKTHLQAMRRVGWEKNEIIELIIFLIVYVGFPSTVDAIQMVAEVFEDKK
jgi:4-carboxymuconolactone decarboxylase